MRTLQYAPFLCAAGIDFKVEPFFDDDYLPGSYSGRVSWASVLRSFARRLSRLRRTSDFDVVWAEKELLPWLPFWLDAGLLPSNTRLVVDYDDAVFHRYDQHRLGAVRAMLGNKIDRVMERANLVTAGNQYLAERARRAGCDRVEWLPTVVDLERYSVKVAAHPVDGRVTIGWIGSFTTAPFLKMVVPALENVATRIPIRCVAIGATPKQVSGTPFEAWSWSESNEVDMLHQFDIGIMPLPDSPFERGKCGYKLIQYMACGLPVVASPVGVNREIVTPDVGFLASGEADWIGAISRLAMDQGSRSRLGQAGRQSVEQTYSLQRQARRLVEMLYSVVGSGS
jgi:glycosyltransferase involved in cell wall biosynthesis